MLPRISLLLHKHVMISNMTYAAAGCWNKMKVVFAKSSWNACKEYLACIMITTGNENNTC